MENIRYIDSLKNSLVREVTLVKEKSRWRKKTGQFVVEGKREVEMALKGGYLLEKIFFHSDILPLDNILELFSPYQASPEIIEVSKDVYRRLAYREKTEGIVAVGQSKPHELDSLKFRRKNPLILIAEAIEKPGNIGALLRTADAAALDAVIIANPKTDLYNPNIIRSSLGCLFTVPIAQANTDSVIEFLKEKGIKSFAASLQASSTYSDMDFNIPAAIVVGAESTGLSADWTDKSDHSILIPMQGEIDSMNVSVSAAILIFEAMRQRSFTS